MKCAKCQREVQDRRFRGEHWLCGMHRKQQCAALLREKTRVTEYTLLRGLVFDFPASCERDEALARANYVSETWHCREKPRAVLRAHRMLGRVAVTATTTASETLDLVTEFIAFILRHAADVTHTPKQHEKLLELCATKVFEWYPVLIRPAPIRELMRAERIVRIVRRETGSVLFLVKSDLVAALSNLPLDIAERIYVAYIGLIATIPKQAIRLC
jgi:hypothetical protein